MSDLNDNCEELREYFYEKIDTEQFPNKEVLNMYQDYFGNKIFIVLMFSQEPETEVLQSSDLYPIYLDL